MQVHADVETLFYTLFHSSKKKKLTKRTITQLLAMILYVHYWKLQKSLCWSNILWKLQQLLCQGFFGYIFTTGQSNKANRVKLLKNSVIYMNFSHLDNSSCFSSFISLGMKNLSMTIFSCVLGIGWATQKQLGTHCDWKVCGISCAACFSWWTGEVLTWSTSIQELMLLKVGLNRLGRCLADYQSAQLQHENQEGSTKVMLWVFKQHVDIYVKVGCVTGSMTQTQLVNNLLLATYTDNLKVTIAP